MWANCRAYNAEGSDICRLAGRLEKQLAAAWRGAGLPRKPPQDAAGAHRSTALAGSPARAPSGAVHPWQQPFRALPLQALRTLRNSFCPEYSSGQSQYGINNSAYAATAGHSMKYCARLDHMSGVKQLQQKIQNVEQGSKSGGGWFRTALCAWLCRRGNGSPRWTQQET